MREVAYARLLGRGAHCSTVRWPTLLRRCMRLSSTRTLQLLALITARRASGRPPANI
jgi:hypothetical protein